VKVAKLGSGRIDPDECQILSVVGFEQRAVVAADVYHQLPGFQIDELLDSAYLVGKMLNHGLVQSRAIAVTEPIELVKIVGMVELDQPAAATPFIVFFALDQLEGPGGELSVTRLGKNSSQGLHPEM